MIYQKEPKNLRKAGWSAANHYTIMVRRSGEMKWSSQAGIYGEMFLFSFMWSMYSFMCLSWLLDMHGSGPHLNGPGVNLVTHDWAKSHERKLFTWMFSEQCSLWWMNAFFPCMPFFLPGQHGSMYVCFRHTVSGGVSDFACVLVHWLPCKSWRKGAWSNH